MVPAVKALPAAAAEVGPKRLVTAALIPAPSAKTMSDAPSAIVTVDPDPVPWFMTTD